MKKFLSLLGLNVLPLIINFYLSTIRIYFFNKPDDSVNCIYIFWHSKMLAGWYIFKGKKFTALVSKSKDGEILTNILNKWNYKIVRGSSSKGGKEALSEIISIINQKNSAVITPDGPNGPRNEIKNGALIISNKCDVPLIPVKIFYHRKITFHKSWDKFELPLPFSKCDIQFGEKYYYREYLEGNALEKLKEYISDEM